MTAQRFSLYWEVQNSNKYTGTPTFQDTKNDLDAHGSFLDLKRLPKEDNVSYYKRLQSVIPLRAGSDHNGLVHGITRELGLEEKIGLKITPVSSNGKWLAKSPYIEITSTEVILYSDYVDSDTYTIDKRIDIFNHGEGYLLSDLISQIQLSENFVAELGPYMTGQEKSNGLFPGTSSVTIQREYIPSSPLIFLDNTDLMFGSVFFTEKNTFSKEVSISSGTTSPYGLTFAWCVESFTSASGEYYIDYENGIVHTHSIPSGNGSCRYTYRDFPWYIRWSPIVTYSLRDSNYRNQIFETETTILNESKQGLVTTEGAEVYKQVYDKSPCLWSE